MIEVSAVESIVNELLIQPTEFIVDVNVSSTNKISVLIDSDEAITIDRCIKISRAIEQHFDRDVEDFEIEVSSAGLSSPLKLPRQYKKNIGENLIVLLNNGEKRKGKLITVTDKGFTLEVQAMIKPEGKKRKKLVTNTEEFNFGDFKTATVEISFR